MKWIKATERLPEENREKELHMQWEWGGKPVKGVGRYVGYFIDNNKGTLDIRIDEIEWLDETPESPDLPTVEELKRECELRYPDSNNKGTSLWGDRLIIAVQRDAYISGRKKNIARIKELEEKLRQTEEIAQIATGALKEASKEVDGLKAEIEHLQNTIDNLKDERRELRKEINGRLED
jgi:hypothetical protein